MVLLTEPPLYEYPTLTGWSRKMTEAFAFQEYGLLWSFRFLSSEAGPNSRKSPVKDEHPGPPFSQRTTGSVLGSLRDSKNPDRRQQLHVIYNETTAKLTIE
jgi:hypothetical protein